MDLREDISLLYYFACTCNIWTFIQEYIPASIYSCCMNIYEYKCDYLIYRIVYTDAFLFEAYK